MNELFNLAVKCPGTELPQALEMPGAAALGGHLGCGTAVVSRNPPNCCRAGTIPRPCWCESEAT